MDALVQVINVFFFFFFPKLLLFIFIFLGSKYGEF